MDDRTSNLLVVLLFSALTCGCEGSQPASGFSSAVDHLCYEDECVDVSSGTSQQIALWLDPSTLPAVGATASTWPDRSGNHNDAHAVSTLNPPVVIDRGLALLHYPSGPGSLPVGGGLTVESNATLDLGTGDFTILVVADLSSGVGPLFSKQNGQRGDARRDVTLFGGSADVTGAINSLDPLVHMSNPGPRNTRTEIVEARHLLVLRRVQSQLELRADGVLQDSYTHANVSATTTNDNDVHIGGFPLVTDGTAVAGMSGVMVIRGSLATADLEKLEQLLQRSLIAAR
jgi:hypothetical protein